MKDMWPRLIDTGSLPISILIVVGVWTGFWNDLISAIWLYVLKFPSPPSLVTGPLNIAVVAAVLVYCVFWYRPYLRDLIQAARGISYKAPEGPPPMGAMSLFDLVNRVMVSVREAPPTNVAVYGEINDALQSGALLAWGRPSRGYPTKPGPQFEKSVPIPSQFWKDNVIEQLHDFYQRGGNWSHVFEPRKEPTITKPVSGWLSRKWFRNRALHRWDISFETDQVRALWPSRNSWMSL